MDEFVKKVKDDLNISGHIEKVEIGLKKFLNIQSRHDEPHEKAHDEAIEKIRSTNRFQSFSKQRLGNNVKWFVDGHDYFYAVSEILESAKHSIFIQDWWLTPELYLRRPPAFNQKWRLDRILKRKADQGVKIFVIVYKEVAVGGTMNSQHTKHALEALSPNVACMRHPDHFGEETVLFWSHHQKVIIVDDSLACVGGLDLCFGRWDTSSHPLADAHLSDFLQTIWPGQDYNNARVQDFQNVEQWVSNQQSRMELPRMPWHDTHMMIEGPSVLDICQEFVERWNFIYDTKYKKKVGTGGRYELLAFPHGIINGPIPQDPTHPEYEPVRKHPHFEHWSRIGRRFNIGNLSSSTDFSYQPNDLTTPKGNMIVQVVRSCGDWSNGTTTERSIQNAYIQLIEQAQRFIYIENQFFITTCGNKGKIQNKIGLALANRIVQAARANEPFKVVVAIPCIPGFAGNLDSGEPAGGTLTIMDWTYKSICRGPNSIFSYVQNHGVDPRQYISFWNLRSFDRINNDPATLEEIERRTGINYYQTQAALSRIYLGDNSSPEELERNKVVEFKLAQKGENLEKGLVSFKAYEGETIKKDLPDTLDEAYECLRRWSEAVPNFDKEVPDSIATQNYPTGLENVPWLGNEESERAAFVNEELYIHTKMMIIDDQKVIMGSANINDRSMMGDRDSEIALVVEDQDVIDSQMAGQYWQAARFAATLRRRLYKQHLGLLSPQSSLLQPNEPTRSMLPVNVPQEDETGTEEDQLVMDPMGRELEDLWVERARVNTECFNKVFRCVPAANILSWEDYKEYVPSGPNAPKVGHVAPTAGSLIEVKRELSRIKGNLVEMPLDFLEKEEKLAEESASVNPITMDIYT